MPAPVFPTHVGMVRRSWSCSCVINSFPHARGDGPFLLPFPFLELIRSVVELMSRVAISFGTWLKFQYH